MPNVQVVDDADNATFALFRMNDEAFALVFPDGRDLELADDLFARLGEAAAAALLAPVWESPVAKRDAAGIQGTLFYGARWREALPPSRREADRDPRSLNAAQRALYASPR